MPRLLIILVLACGAVFSQTCTPTDYARADEASTKPHTWDAFYRFYKNHGRCIGVDTAELVSETVARIFVDHWSTLPRLGKLSADHGFRSFVLGGINATLDMKDVRSIHHLAVRSCPSGLRQLCADIKQHAEQAEAEDAYYERK